MYLHIRHSWSCLNRTWHFLQSFYYIYSKITKSKTGEEDFCCQDKLQNFPTFFYKSCVTRQIRTSLTSNPTDLLTQISGLEVISVAATTAVVEGTTRPQVGIVVEPWAQTSTHPSFWRQNTGSLDWKKEKTINREDLEDGTDKTWTWEQESQIDFVEFDRFHWTLFLPYNDMLLFWNNGL